MASVMNEERRNRMNQNLTPFTCAACTKTVMHDPTKGHVPVGWRMRRIENTTYLLCDEHSIDAHFHPSMSPFLKSLFAEQGISFKDET